MARGTNCVTTDGPSVTICCAVNGLEGPSVAAVHSLGGRLIGGNIHSMTGTHIIMTHSTQNLSVLCVWGTYITRDIYVQDTRFLRGTHTCITLTLPLQHTCSLCCPIILAPAFFPNFKVDSGACIRHFIMDPFLVEFS